MRRSGVSPSFARLPGLVDGFTLVELLVVMALLSLIALGMGSALRTTAQTGERVDRRLLEADELRVSTAFLRSVVGRVYPFKLNTPTSSGQLPYFFEGKPDALTWVGIMPARHGVGGRFFFRLSLGEFDGARGLVLQFLPWDSAAGQPDWTHAEARLLVHEAVGLRMLYANTMVDQPQWGLAWESTDSFPDRIMISLQTTAGNLPDLVIPVRPTPSGVLGGASGEAVFGGGAR